MPRISPAALNSGPPELPWLMAASVWRNSASSNPPETCPGLSRPLRWPTVRVPVAAARADGGVPSLRHSLQRVLDVEATNPVVELGREAGQLGA